MKWTINFLNRSLKQRGFLYPLWMIFLFFHFSALFAEDLGSFYQRFHGVIEKIHQVKQLLFSSQSQQKSLQDELKKIEQSIASKNLALQTTQQQLLKKRKALNENQNKQAELKKYLEQAQEKLFHQMLTLYQLGNQPLIKITLNQENPDTIERYLHYYRYLHQSQQKTLEAIQQASIDLRKCIDQIQRETQGLKKIETEQIAQQSVLKKEQQHRYLLIQKIQQDIQSQQYQLHQLIENKNRLQQLILQLKQEKKRFGVSDDDFNHLRSRLAWPIDHGQLIQRFGESIYGQLQSNGLTIQSTAGEAVHAICAGKIIFAEWLKGFGLLVIIQHGQHYMTLYGHNQNLFVHVGQIVQTGEIISSVGNTGGYVNDGLYFEIRYNGLPVNPLHWLKPLPQGIS